MTTTPIAGPFPGLVPGPAGSTGQSATSGSTGDAFLALVQGLLDDVSAQPPVDLTPATPNAESTVATTSDILATLVKPVTDDQVAVGAAPDAPASELPGHSAPRLQRRRCRRGPRDRAVGHPARAGRHGGRRGDRARRRGTRRLDRGRCHRLRRADRGAGGSDRRQARQGRRAGLRDVVHRDLGAGRQLPDVAVTRVEQRPAATEQRSTSSAQAPVTTVTAVSGAAPITAAAPAPTDSGQVTRQVFPEVVRVVNNPAGPQRVTIKLNPEALGEVRVVLTSRGGHLEVSLAAGAEARAALTDGASELHRLLDMVGRGDSRIVVRDLLGALPGTTVSQPAATSSGSGVPTDLAGGAGNGTGRPGGETATGEQSRNNANGSNNATDGTPAPTNPSRLTESDTRAHTGLDVSM